MGRNLFAAQGYERTTIGHVCSGAKVSTRAFYEEFTNKQSLLLAVHNEVATAGIEAVAAALGEPGIDEAATPERIGRLFGVYAAAVTADAAAAKVAFVEIQSAGREVDEHRVMWRSLWADFFTAEVDRAVGRGEADDRDYSLGIVALIGAVNELVAHWSRVEPRSAAVPADDLAAELTRLALGLLGVRTGGGS